MRHAVFALSALALLCFTGCEDEPVTTVSVSFTPSAVSLTGDQETVVLRPVLNLDPSDIRSAEWEVTHVTGYLVDFDMDGEVDTEEPPLESVAIGGASSAFEAEATFTFQGIYILQVTVETLDRRTGVGSIKVTVGDVNNITASSLPVGPSSNG